LTSAFISHVICINLYSDNPHFKLNIHPYHLLTFFCLQSVLSLTCSSLVRWHRKLPFQNDASVWLIHNGDPQ